jgi:hypothetical protein
MVLVSAVNIRISKMEDLVGSGLTRFFDAFKIGLAKMPKQAEGKSSGGNSVAAGTRAEPAGAYRQS